MDKVRIFGKVVDEHGVESVQAMTVTERDSEVMSKEDVEMMFLFACHNAKLKAIGEIKREYI